MTRRNFLATAAAGLAAQTPARRSTICFFSKHLPELKYDELGKWLHDAGFDGVDLTVRPGGHILPDRAAQDLPRAVETIRSRGLEVPMITTELTSAADPAARPILSTAARLKIPFFKLGYWRYGNDVVADVQKAAADVRAACADTIDIPRPAAKGNMPTTRPLKITPAGPAHLRERTAADRRNHSARPRHRHLT